MEIIAETQGTPLGKRLTDSEQMISRLQVLISNNKHLRHSLIKLDEYVENSDPNLVETKNREGRSQSTRERIENQIASQQLKHETLTKLLKFAAKQQELLQTEKNDQIEDFAYGYEFLRSQWVRYRLKGPDNIEDRLDLFNKVIAKIRYKTIQKLYNVRSQNTTTRYELSLHQIDKFSQFKEKCERYGMEVEDLRCNILRLQEQNTYLSEHYNKTQLELQKTKQKLKNIENKFLSSSKKNIELSESLRKINDQVSALKNQEKLVYNNKEQLLQIQIHCPGTTKGEFQTKVTIEKLLNFLSGEWRPEDSSVELIVAKRGQSSNSIQPVKIFPLHDTEKQAIQMSSCIEPKPKNTDSHGDMSRKYLRRQSSEGSINQNAPKILERTLKYANSAKRICYVKNKSMDKNSEIERKFYVRFQQLDKENPIK